MSRDLQILKSDNHSVACLPQNVRVETSREVTVPENSMYSYAETCMQVFKISHPVTSIEQRSCSVPNVCPSKLTHSTNTYTNSAFRVPVKYTERGMCLTWEYQRSTIRHPSGALRRRLAMARKDKGSMEFAARDHSWSACYKVTRASWRTEHLRSCTVFSEPSFYSFAPAEEVSDTGSYRQLSDVSPFGVGVRVLFSNSEHRVLGVEPHLLSLQCR